MPSFDNTGTWVEGADICRGRGCQAEVIESEKYSSSADPEIGYRPFIYTVQSRSFDWTRLFKWLWGRGLN